MKRISVAILVLLSCAFLAFAGGGKEAGAAKGKIVVGYASMGDTNAFHALVTKGMKSAAPKFGYELIAMDNNWNSETVIQNMEQLMQRKVNVIITGSSDSSIFPVMKKRSQETGIPIILIDMNIPDFYTFGGDSKIAGGIGGDWLADQALKAWGGKVDLYIGLEYPSAGETNELRMKAGFIDSIRKKIDLPDSKIIRLAGNNDIALSTQVTLDTLTANPNAKRILIGNITDDCAQGALAAIQQLGYEDRAFICGQGFYDAISARNFLTPKPTAWGATVAYWPARYGEFIFRVLDEHFKKGKDLPKKWYVEHALVTRDNIQEILKMSGLEM